MANRLLGGTAAPTRHLARGSARCCSFVSPVTLSVPDLYPPHVSRKFLETESPAWVAEGLISAAQQQKLLARYPQEVPALGLLPVLGSVLVGLSGLSLVAANWQALPAALRLALLLGSLVGAYGAGSYFLRRGNADLGHGLMGLGLLLFGASIILTSQLYQLVGYDASGLLAWVVAGTALGYLYGSRLLVLLTVLIGAGVQT